MHRFGPFEVDFAQAELRKNGVTIRLAEQPMRLLEKLLERPGEVVSREELRSALWPSDTFVDFERSLNAAVAKLRGALNDSADQPLYIETVARKGYRFIAPVHRSFPSPERVAHRNQMERLTAVAIIAAVGLLLSLAAWTLRPTLPTGDVGSIHFVVNLPEGTEVAPPSFAQQMAISRDGRLLAVVLTHTPETDPVVNALPGGGGRALANAYLWLRPLASETGRHIEGTDGASRPFWSPNGSEIGFFSGGKLKKVRTSGGPVQTLCDAPEPFGATWGADGTIVFSAGAALLLVSAAGGLPVPLTHLDAARGDIRHAWPEFLPDGRRFLFFAATADPTKSGVYFASLDGAKPQKVLDNLTRAAFAPPDHLLFVRNGVLMTQRWEDPQEPTALAKDVSAFTIGQSAFTVSAQGVLAYRQAQSGALTQVMSYSRDGQKLRTLGPPGTYSQIALSPDEQSAALSVYEGSNVRIWLLRLATSVISRHNFGQANNGDPVWSPDSHRLAFRSFQVAGLRSEIRQWTLGHPNSSAQLLWADGKDNAVDDWSPDGHFLLIRRDNQLALQLPLAPNAKPIPVGDTESPKDQLHLSPDGKRVAYNTILSGRPEVFVANYPGFGERQQVSSAGGVQPHWRRDGKELFYVATNGAIMSVSMTTPRPPVALFKPAAFSFTDSSSQYAVSADGQRFYLLESLGAPSETLHVVTQWDAGLR